MGIPGTSYLLLSMFFMMIMLNGKDICITASEVSDEKLHIVYMGSVQDEGDYQTVHHEMLESVHGSHEAAEQSLKYSYGKSFGGFAAMLSPSHVQQLSNMDGVVSVFESKKRHILTTRSWDFINFPLSGQSKNLDYESDIIIGVLDTGIWPESESFNDAGFGPVPSKWRGGCQTTSDFTSCNKKIIGARYYHASSDPPVPDEDYLSPRDGSGHGTHTSSTAAGNIVKNASVYGIAQGDARGGVPGARIAMYKVCWGPSEGCEDADVLAAFDDAIYDGVDILSVSLGGFGDDYFQNSIAIGAFHAMKRGILTSNACGNDGQEAIYNYSPWSLTVAASTIDRTIESQLLLGNNIGLQGLALNTFTMEQSLYPLIYGGYATNTSGGFTYDNSRSCVANSLDATKVKGNIVLCYQGSEYNPDQTIFLTEGEGIIILDDYFDETARPYLVPATLLNTTQGDVIISYINSTSSPIAKIFKSTTPKEPAPIVASFSSRGPNPITRNILKPDIAAPGVNILAAWSMHSSLTELPGDTRFPKFNIISGTSMACPHATGAAGFVKSYHLEWSPAAIKSALMTTAYIMDASLPHNGDAEFGYGAGQINPAKAINPGLVYETDVNDYIKMLCSQGYNDTTLRLLTSDFSSCDSIEVFQYGALELNYPSIMVVTTPGKSIYAKFSRIVTNVGPPQSTYKVIINTPSGIKVTVSPDTLAFSTLNQKLTYNITIEGGVIPSNSLVSGSLIWVYGNYSVRSPIGVYCHLS
ncbi:subtilisin-like protease SBT4.14 [Cryptomeria japonica]|uniref:subtilisin-like protease SBT4.14 n=1 Tax=Cryptomeria japonica TaxID=3369 RepID=UPI0027DA3F5B|nr:subtilisin-like protease SBT4.14 [Cryptomeria japonica]